MRQELEELQPKLVTAQEENAKMMVVIEKENVEVEARRNVVKKDDAIASEKAAEAQALKDEVMMMSFGESRQSRLFVYVLYMQLVK